MGLCLEGGSGRDQNVMPRVVVLSWKASSFFCEPGLAGGGMGGIEGGVGVGELEDTTGCLVSVCEKSPCRERKHRISIILSTNALQDS